MSTFAERYCNLLKINGLKPVDAIEKTGLPKDIIYNLTSKKSAKKYDEVEKLFKICITPDQIIELAIGERSSEIINTQDYQIKTFELVKKLLIEVDGLKEEIKRLREEKRDAQVGLRKKIPEPH